MAKTMTTQQAAKAMAEAHTDLHIFDAVQQIMEGSLLSTASQSDEFRIIAAVKAAQKRAFARYEKAEAVIAIKPL